MARELPKGKGAKAPVVDISTDIERFASLGVLGTLLADRSTGGNIIWASNVFSDKGESYAPEDEICVADVTGENAGIIRARASKSRDDQAALTRAHAEVFTPLWIVRKMVDWADEAWYEHHQATPTLWRDYVRSPRLEITCGEAPFLVTRYDAADGTRIPVYRRCGALDRKLMQIAEHVRSRSSWLRHATAALKSTYGYEYQGDNLLIARVNVLATIEDFCDTAGWDSLTPDEYKALAEIISWNLWQMDGLKDCVPDGALGAEGMSMDMSGTNESTQVGEQTEIRIMHERGAARIYDWEHAREVEFCALKREVTLMDNGPRIKFDYVIGNPPYQEEQDGDNANFAPPIYHRFMDESFKISRAVELIHPARFLFNAGSTPKAWNKKMLEDEHFKVLLYEQDAAKVFPGTDIKGGIAITYRDELVDFGSIGVFSPYPEVNSVKKKVLAFPGFRGLSEMMYNQTRFNLPAMYADYPEYQSIIGSNGRDRRFRNNIFDKVALFTEEPTYDDDISVLGVISNRRNWRYFPSRYVDTTHENLYAWKLLVVRVNGRGTLGETLSTPVISKPGEGYTQTFIGIGAFETETEANSCLKYVKTKFLRTMLSILKITQDNSIATWAMIPVQDFTTASDIDWSQSVSDIDQQLYAKYGLTQDEIDFIETHVKEMQ